MRFKPGVVLFMTGQHIHAAFEIVEEVWWQMLQLEPTVTSVREGTHRMDSAHYYRPHDGNRWPKNPQGSQGAFDLRTWRSHTDTRQLPHAVKLELALELKQALGRDWYIYVHDTHIHVEHKPVGVTPIA